MKIKYHPGVNLRAPTQKAQPTTAVPIHYLDLDTPVPPEGLKLLRREIEATINQYSTLSWFARANPDRSLDTLKRMRKIELQYPDETLDLADPDFGNCHHGFNVGMLAAAKYFKECLNETEPPEEDCRRYFPDFYSSCFLSQSKFE